MSIALKTHKMLWGRSGNMCAFPECKKELVMDITETDDYSIIGEEAHIVARETDGPRGYSLLSSDERDKYDNLILLCSIHHKNVDDFPDIYSVELLKTYKTNHENWIKQNLRFDLKKQHEDEVYSTYIDEIIKNCDIENWRGWTSFLLSPGLPRIFKEQYDILRKLIQYILSRVWYGRYPELEDAIHNFNNVLNDLLRVFDKYCEYRQEDGYLLTLRFYKIEEWNPDLYKELEDKFEFHIHLIDDLVLELTRAANYIFDKVRESLLPSFRIKEGVLLVETGPFMDFSWRTFRAEYKGEERTSLPYPGLREFMEIRSKRNFSFGKGISDDYFPLYEL